MAFVYKLKVSHFRGLENFEQTFSNGITCIIGRGDSGKTSILEAIAAVLHPTYDRRFYDTDFYNCDISKPILIEAVVKNLPDSIIAKYGKHIVGILNNEIIEDMESENAIDSEPALKIKLSVSEDLEPHWVVYSEHSDDEMSISATDRAKLNMAYLSDYSDRHFSLMKGTPLYAKNRENDDNEENTDEVLSVLRDAKEKIDVSAGPKFNKTIECLKDSIEKLGIDGSKINARLDQKDFLLKENKLSLHNDLIPLRMNGRGSKRIYSLAIQLAVTKNDSIILIDEIETGLEPDRVQHLVSTIQQEYPNAQIIFTTHSQNAIVELEYNQIFVMRNAQKSLITIDKEMQGCLRAYPWAFFSKKLIVCEGASEEGFVMALDDWRIRNKKKSLSYLGVSIVNAKGGDKFIILAQQFTTLGYETCIYCDSDDSGVNKKKSSVTCSLFQCDDNLSFESQLFKDSPWDVIKKIIEYRINVVGDEQSVFTSINSMLSSQKPFSADWLSKDSNELRDAITKASVVKKKEWFKNITAGIDIGNIVFEELDSFKESTTLKKNILALINWIEN